MVKLEGINLSGEFVVGMKDKQIEIVKKPYYETFKEEGLPDKKKPCISVQLADGNVLNWYPNKATLKVLMAWYGFEMDNWVNAKFHILTAKQNVAGNMKDVIYIDEVKPHSLKKT